MKLSMAGGFILDVDQLAEPDTDMLITPRETSDGTIRDTIKRAAAARRDTGPGEFGLVPSIAKSDSADWRSTPPHASIQCKTAG